MFFGNLFYRTRNYFCVVFENAFDIVKKQVLPTQFIYPRKIRQSGLQRADSKHGRRHS